MTGFLSQRGKNLEDYEIVFILLTLFLDIIFLLKIVYFLSFT